MEVLFVFFHGAAINDRFHGMCATAPRNLACVSTLSLDVDDLLMHSLGGRVEADDAAVESLAELPSPHSGRTPRQQRISRRGET